MNKRRGAAAGAVMAFASVLLTAACAPAYRTPDESRATAALPHLRVEGDSGITDTLAPGVLHRSFTVAEGPWAIHVLDIDRAACWAPVAAKGAPGASGRSRTSVLASGIRDSTNEVAGGVNADFFLFDPPGVPTGVHVHNDAVITGPGARPVFAIDRDGKPWIGVLSDTGLVTADRDSIPVSAWNRLAPTGIAWFDARYGASIDTLRGSVRVAVTSPRSGVIQSIDSSLVPTPIPSSGGVLVIGPRAERRARDRLLALARSGRRVEVDVRLTPMHPREAVGGFPILVRDSAEVPGLDSAGAANFAPVRHPRTIVGVSSGGRRLLLIVIDGRQAGYSVGTTNRESARVALALGATEAINLDGGGSTTMVVARTRGDSTWFEVANRPSDSQGERAVGNALVIARARHVRC